ncbi:MAG: ATP-binding protein [Thermoplasmata archaeon M11B2D]|nr:MAG: ATP-binding protein [Thermoplasmata archaeon M11B2D]
MYLSEDIKKKWQPIVEHEALPKIEDPYRKAVTTIVLENQARFTKEKTGRELMVEATSSDANNVTAGVDKYDPVLVSLVRRSTPNLLAFDVAGVQPMSGPTGLLFAIRARYTNQSGGEALFGEANTAHSGTGTHAGDTSGFPADFFGVGDPAVGTDKGVGMDVAVGEAKGTDSGTAFNQMAFTIEKTSVEAKTRALKAEYTTELAQDLRAIHGLDAENELANILSTEILAEQNRELIRTINISAKYGFGGTGSFDAASTVSGGDADGRWFVERFKAVLFQIELEANEIAKSTRRGRGNFVITSSNVASALAMAGILDYAPAMSTNLQVDDTGNLFAGVINGRIKVYVDPYATIDYVTVGYRGSNQFDAGIFWAPYVPLEMVRAVGEDSFQPKIGFKTRYGIVANPFATIVDPIAGTPVGGQSGLGAGQNFYYRKFRVLNLI